MTSKTDIRSRLSRLIRQTDRLPTWENLVVLMWILTIGMTRASLQIVAAQYMGPVSDAERQIADTVAAVLGLGSIYVVSYSWVTRGPFGRSWSDVPFRTLGVQGWALWMLIGLWHDTGHKLIALAHIYLLPLVSLAIGIWLLKQIRWATVNKYDPLVGPASTSGEGAFMLSGIELVQPTARDRMITATHEAGHALILAALPQLPDSMTASIIPRSDLHSLGHIHWDGPDLLISLPSLQWKMLLYLAGYVAETLFLDAPSLGSRQDYMLWTSLATEFSASAMADEYYFLPAQSEHEAAANQQVLTRLRQKQIVQLQEFLKLNSDVLLSLRQKLMETETIQAEDLRMILAGTQIPTTFPRPTVVE